MGKLLLPRTLEFIRQIKLSIIGAVLINNFVIMFIRDFVQRSTLQQR